MCRCIAGSVSLTKDGERGSHHAATVASDVGAGEFIASGLKDCGTTEISRTRLQLARFPFPDATFAEESLSRSSGTAGSCPATDDLVPTLHDGEGDPHVEDPALSISRDVTRVRTLKSYGTCRDTSRGRLRGR